MRKHIIIGAGINGDKASAIARYIEISVAASYQMAKAKRHGK